jgi:hypothetical protein
MPSMSARLRPGGLAITELCRATARRLVLTRQTERRGVRKDTRLPELTSHRGRSRRHQSGKQTKFHCKNPFALSHRSRTVSTTEAFERAFAFAALARAPASDGLTFMESVTERVSGRGGSAEGFSIAAYLTIVSI